jgi:hypothetical protein
MPNAATSATAANGRVRFIGESSDGGRRLRASASRLRSRSNEDPCTGRPATGRRPHQRLAGGCPRGLVLQGFQRFRMPVGSPGRGMPAAAVRGPTVQVRLTVGWFVDSARPRSSSRQEHRCCGLRRTVRGAGTPPSIDKTSPQALSTMRQRGWWEGRPLRRRARSSRFAMNRSSASLHPHPHGRGVLFNQPVTRRKR